MALLSKAERKRRLEYLGYKEDDILKFQKKAFPDNKTQQDSKYGKNTDRALRHFYNVKKVTKDFEPEEFRCNCGHCTGYPSYMKQVELKHLQKIRSHYKKPMKVTSGLRCAYENSRVGGAPNSGHLHGYASDFYMEGVTETVTQRIKALAWIKKQPNHKFTYGADMRDSNGLYRTASGMGNAMHTETHKPTVKPLVAKAKELAWPKGTKSSKYKYPSGSPTSAFKEALNKAYPNRGSWGAAPKKGASCDVFVGTCVRSAGIDKNFPRGLSEQMKYKSSAFNRYVYRNVAPINKARAGDIIMYTHDDGTHIVILGNGCYYEANHEKKYGHVNTSSRLNTKFKKVIILRAK